MNYNLLSEWIFGGYMDFQFFFHLFAISDIVDFNNLV